MEPCTPPPEAEENPEIAEFLREEEAIGLLWDDLNRLIGVRRSLGEERYRHAVLKITARFLGIDEARFSVESLEMVRGLEQAISEYRLLSGGGREADRRFEERRDRATLRFRRLLGSTARHRQFHEQVSAWASFLIRSEE